MDAITQVLPAPPVGPELAGAEHGRQTAFRLSRGDRLLSYVILVCGLLTVIVGAMQIITSHSLVPLWDEWQEIDAIVTAPHHWPPISWLWSLHNEHRVVFYRLLLLADIHIFHGKSWICFLSMLVVQLLFLVLLAWMLWFSEVKGTLWRALVGLAAFCLFCPTQWENFGWAFQISFLLPGFLATLSLAALLKYERSVRQSCPKWIYLGLSILAASAATYSSANGVVLWPMLLLVAIGLVPRPGVIGAYSGFGIVMIGSYLYHYAGPSIHSSPLGSIRHPLAVLEYTAGYMGIILPAWVRTRDFVAVSSGTLGLFAALAVTVWALRGRREPLQMALLGLIFFALSTAFITALGRIGFGLSQAFASRYQTFNLLFWFSTVSLLLLLADRFSSSLRTIVLAAIAFVLLLAPAVFPLGLKASRTRIQKGEAANTALLAGVPDKQALEVLFLDASLVWRDSDYFRQQHLYMFSDEKNNQMGHLLSSTYRVGSSLLCQGQVAMAETVPSEDLLLDEGASALRLSGWAVDRSSNTPIRKLVITAGDKIVGYAGPNAGPFTAKHSDIVRKKDSSEWLGYARPPREAVLMEVYAVGGNNDTACRLAAVQVPRR